MIKLFVSDFDGVFTDSTISIDNNGLILKNYNVKDGYGIKLLQELNIKICIISSYKYNKSQENILKHLNCDNIIFDSKNKLDTLVEICNKYNIDIYNDVSYIGDDLNDVDIMKTVKNSACPKDAFYKCKEICTFICNKKGGKGAIREFIDYIINHNL